MIMADIVVFDVTVAGNKAAKRRAGMQKLGEVFNTNFQDTSLSENEVVNKTIQHLIGVMVGSTSTPQYSVTYKGDTNVMSIKNAIAGTYVYQPGPPEKKVKLVGKKDDDNSGTEVMNIAISEGNTNLLQGETYLTNVIEDVGGVPSQASSAYLLGTITFRRCR